MEVSIVEFLVYALVCYAGVISLVVSAFKGESGSTGTGAKIIWLIPSMICAVLLANVGGDINFGNITTDSTLVNANTTETWNETVTFSMVFTLQNPVWVSIHWLFFIIMLIYILFNIIRLITTIK